MITGIDALTEKEKVALRLLLRGHDAKSSARELGLSVHTVNERLRDARRKLGTTSSREAARLLLEGEGTAPESLVDKPLGDAPEGPAAADQMASAPRRWAWLRLALTLSGVTAMSLVLAALFLPASPLSLAAPYALTETVAGAERPSANRPEAADAARAAEDFLKLIDESRWAESYAATGAQFRKANTLKVWTDVSERVRLPLGKLLTRNLVTNEYVPAPPQGYQLVKFRSTYTNGTEQTESVSLAWEDGAWRVAGITFEGGPAPAKTTRDEVNLDAVQRDARAWLALIDAGNWQGSHVASGAAFRNAITAEGWAAAAAQAREPLGHVVKRDLLEYGSQSAPRELRIVMFQTDFANKPAAKETVTLEREGGGFRVVGYWIN